MSMSEAAETLGVSTWTLYQVVHAGDLPTIKIQTRRLVAEADLQNFIEKLRAEGRERHGL